MLGYGPRYLHSTGQLHKGGANNGVFLIVTRRPRNDVPVPDAPYSFGILEMAQALGDFQSLDRANRRAAHVTSGPNRDSMADWRFARNFTVAAENYKADPAAYFVYSSRWQRSRFMGPRADASDARTRARRRGGAAPCADAAARLAHTREDEIAIRAALAEAWLLQDDLAQAAATLGRPPDTLREPSVMRCSPHCGDCTAASPTRAASSRARSPFIRAR
jgi:hypothetical protein